MIKILWCIDNNVPISNWRKESRLKDLPEETTSRFEHPSNSQVFFHSFCKKIDKTVGAIVNAMSHPDAVDLLVKEWNLLPSILRMKLTQALNDACGTRSGNKTKGILRLDKMLGGKVLAKTDTRQTDRDLRVIGGRVVSRQRPVNPAVAGATRAHATFWLPQNYNQMTPAEKRRLRKKLAKERKGNR